MQRKHEVEDKAKDGMDTSVQEIPIHLHIGMAMIEALEPLQGDAEHGLARAADLKATSVAIENNPVETTLETLRHCRLAKQFNSKVKQIIFACPVPVTARLLAASLQKAGANRLMGRAPPGAQERDIARTLSRFE